VRKKEFGLAQTNSNILYCGRIARSYTNESKFVPGNLNRCGLAAAGKLSSISCGTAADLKRCDFVWQTNFFYKAVAVWQT
jgi:hypothetical protein